MSDEKDAEIARLTRELDEARASEASLRKALEECTDAIKRWGAEEDGLPGDQVGAYQSYVRAMQLLQSVVRRCDE